MNTLPTNVLYDIYCPKSDGSVILLGWSSINARQMLSVSSATIVLPRMAMTDKSESLSVVIVDLSQVWSLRRQENDLSASVLPIGKTARIFSSSRILGKKIPSAKIHPFHLPWIRACYVGYGFGSGSSKTSVFQVFLLQLLYLHI